MWSRRMAAAGGRHWQVGCGCWQRAVSQGHSAAQRTDNIIQAGAQASAALSGLSTLPYLVLWAAEGQQHAALAVGHEEQRRWTVRGRASWASQSGC